MVHQQGIQGAIEHYTHPERIAWQSMCATDEGLLKGEHWCKRCIWGNLLPEWKRAFGNVDNIQSGEFIAKWTGRIDHFADRYSVASADAVVGAPAKDNARDLTTAPSSNVRALQSHVLKSGCRWCDCPPEYGPPTTIYNRFVRWARRGVWENLFRELAGNGRSTDTQMIDSTHVKAHRSVAGGKGGSRSRLLAARAEGATRRFTHSQMLKGAFSPSC